TRQPIATEYESILLERCSFATSNSYDRTSYEQRGNGAHEAKSTSSDGLSWDGGRHAGHNRRADAFPCHAFWRKYRQPKGLRRRRRKRKGLLTSGGSRR